MIIQFPIRTAEALSNEKDFASQFNVQIVTCDEEGNPKSESYVALEQILKPVSVQMQRRRVMAKVTGF